MSIPDPNLQAILAQTDEAYAKATEDGSWYPDEDGLYNCLVEKVDSGSKSKDGKVRVWFKVNYKILNGKYEGRTMSSYYSFVTDSDPEDLNRDLGKIKSYVKIVNNGAFGTTTADAYALACNSAGAMLEIDKSTRNSNGRTFVNLTPKRLLQSR